MWQDFSLPHQTRLREAVIKAAADDGMVSRAAMKQVTPVRLCHSPLHRPRFYSTPPVAQALTAAPLAMNKQLAGLVAEAAVKHAPVAAEELVHTVREHVANAIAQAPRRSPHSSLPSQRVHSLRLLSSQLLSMPNLNRVGEELQIILSQADSHSSGRIAKSVLKVCLTDRSGAASSEMVSMHA